MKYLHIVAFDPLTNKSVTRATCVLEDGARSVVCTGDAGLIAELRPGFFHPGLLRTVTLDDGEPFLQAVAFEYRHPALFATEVLEGKVVEPYALPESQPPGRTAAA